MSARAVLVLASLAACAAEDPPQAAAGAAQPGTATFELRDVVSAALAGRPRESAPSELGALPAQELEGLTGLAASDPGLLTVAREDVARMGRDSAAVWARLAQLAREPDRPDAERAAAIDLVNAAGAGEAAGARALLELVADAEPAWLRGRAAWRLALEGPDHIVPALVLRLKYETDHETVVWIATALARHGNLSGLDGLIAVARDPASRAQALAAAQLEELLSSRGLEDVAELTAAWERPASTRGFGGEPRSERFRFAVLEWIARLAEFQLRGVDDARFILERMDDAAARELGAALHERDVYIRVHSAQCLQRMGPRGAPAGPQLEAALAEPELAPHAALALGKVGHAGAEQALLARLSADTPLALRLAAVRGLGYLDSLSAQEAQRALSPLLSSEPAELAQAAAESLLRRQPASSAAAASLADFLLDARVDPGSSERALGEWLAGLEDAEASTRWNALAPPATRVETPAETRERRTRRAQIVRTVLRNSTKAAD